MIQTGFGISFLALSWLAMMATHELGHVLGGVATGGTVARVVLHPLAISRTDLSVNPQPAIVVWAGPLVGVLLPLVFLLVAKRLKWSGAALWQFFVGFCLIANGAYIAGGAWEGIGDCGVMHQTGTPIWVMWCFGLVTVPAGFWLWHRLGSLREWWQHPERVSEPTTVRMCLALLISVVLMDSFSA